MTDKELRPTVQKDSKNIRWWAADEDGGILMDAKYLAEIKARLDAGRLPMKSDMEALLAEVERLTEDNIALKAELQDSHQDHIDDFMRLVTETATLKKALTRACEEISDYALPSGTGRMKSVLITARIEKFMNHAKQVQEQEGKE